MFHDIGEDLRFAPEPAGLLRMTAFIDHRCGHALGDLGLDDFAGLPLGEAAPRRFGSADAFYPARVMRASGGGSSHLANRNRFCVVDRGQRRPERGCRTNVTRPHRREQGVA